MTIRRRAGVSWAAALVSIAFSSLATPSCQRSPSVAPAALAPAPAHSQSAAPRPAHTTFDRAIALVEARTGERLTLAWSEHDDGAVYPAWLPDNRLVVPGLRGVTIVDPRSGVTSTLTAKGRRAVVSPDGKTMAIASNRAVELLDVGSGESLGLFDTSPTEDAEVAIQFSPDSRLFAFFPMIQSREAGRLLGLYDVAKRAMRGVLELRAPGKPAPGLTAKLSAPPDANDGVVAFELRDERLVATLASGGTALWDTGSLRLLVLLAGGREDAEPREHHALLSGDGAFAAAWIPIDASPTRNKAGRGAAPIGAPPAGVIRAERRWTPLLLDARRGEVVMRLEDKQCVPFGFAMHPREPLLAVGSVYPGYCVWDLAKRKVKQRFRIPPATPKDKASGAGLMLRLAAKMSPKVDLPIEHVTFDASGEHLTLAIANLGGIVVSWSDGTVSDGALSKDSHLEDFPGGAAATSPDQSMVTGSGGDMRVWDVASGRIVRRMGQHEKHAAIDWTAEAITLVGVDGTVVRIRAATGELLERRPRPSGFDDAKTVSAGPGTLVMLSSRPSGLRALRVDDPSKVVPLAWPGSIDGIVAAAASGNGHRIAVSSSEQLAVFDATTGAALRALEPRPAGSQESHAPTDVALDDEGQLVAAVVEDTPHLWEVATGREIALSPGDCTDVRFRPRTRLLVGSCHDKIRVWHGQTGTPVVSVDSGDLPEGIFFDKSGDRMAQLGAKYITLLDGLTFAAVSKTESARPTWTATFSPSSRFVAVGMQQGGGVDFYRADDGKRVARLQISPNDEAWVLRAENGKVEILGDAQRVESDLECRVGPHVFPWAACEERFVVKGLLADLLSERMSDAL